MQLTINPNEHAEILQKKGKSFHLASYFLGRKDFAKAAALYAFLRRIDDQIDEAPDAITAKHRLERIVSTMNQPTLAATAGPTPTFAINSDSLAEFLRGMRYDIETVAISTAEELEDYCYCVAGTVGEMMCQALNCTDQRALSHAVDMGVAMQMTNIARDVYEDAQMGRRYLPASWVGDVTPDEMLAPSSATEADIKMAICRLIDRADRRYHSARRGICLLPMRSRLAILSASQLYQSIGHKIKKQEAINWRQRTVVSATGKSWRVANSILQFFCQRHYWQYQQEPGIGKPKKSLKIITHG